MIKESVWTIVVQGVDKSFSVSFAPDFEAAIRFKIFPCALRNPGERDFVGIDKVAGANSCNGISPVSCATPGFTNYFDYQLSFTSALALTFFLIKIGIQISILLQSQSLP